MWRFDSQSPGRSEVKDPRRRGILDRRTFPIRRLRRGVSGHDPNARALDREVEDAVDVGLQQAHAAVRAVLLEPELPGFPGVAVEADALAAAEALGGQGHPVAAEEVAGV